MRKVNADIPLSSSGVRMLEAPLRLSAQACHDAC